MSDIRLGTAAKELLDQINQMYPGEVLVRFGDTKSGYVRHDQATRDALGSRIVVQVTDVTAPDYTATHELMHILLPLVGFPQIFFHGSFGDEKLDEQLMIMTTSLYNVIAHEVVVTEQRRHHLINETVAKQYALGVATTLTKEDNGNDDEAALRLLILLDALVFYADDMHKTKYLKQFKNDYPIAFKAATTIYKDVLGSTIDSPFTMHRAIVKLFKAFDKQMLEWDMPKLHSTEFVTVSSVLSQRQLRMQVRQIFEVFHSEMLDKQTGERAYVGLNRTTRQNSFVLSVPDEATGGSTEWFKQLYDMSVEELFDSLALPYTIREVAES